MTRSMVVIELDVKTHRLDGRVLCARGGKWECIVRSLHILVMCDLMMIITFSNFCN